MFKGIAQNLIHKAEALRQQNIVQKAIDRSCTRYAIKVQAVFDDRTRAIRLTTTSKAAASEVLLRLGEIQDELRRTGVQFRKISVR